MAETLDKPETDWDVTYDTEVVEGFKSIDDEELRERVRTTLLNLTSNPMKGAPLSVSGCRATHAEHLVIVWEVREGETGDPITRREQLTDLGEVYVHGVAHHDQTRNLLSGEDDPAGIE